MRPFLSAELLVGQTVGMIILIGMNKSFPTCGMSKFSFVLVLLLKPNKVDGLGRRVAGQGFGEGHKTTFSTTTVSTKES